MTTIDILVCTLNKGVVRIADILLPEQEYIRYVVSFQYTDERYIELIPDCVHTRKDVVLNQYVGQGLSVNRNKALEHATSDLIMFADDDSRFSLDEIHTVIETFDENPTIDVAFFQASTYTGRPLKDYPNEAFDVTSYPHTFFISAIEMVCRRDKVQGKVLFNERIGLGTKMLTCGEEEVWFEDARRLGLKMRYIPKRIVETSTILKNRMIYVDPGVQRSKGAIAYYLYGHKAWWICFKFAVKATVEGSSHFFPLMKHLVEGIRYMKRNRGKK